METIFGEEVTNLAKGALDADPYAPLAVKDMISGLSVLAWEDFDNTYNAVITGKPILDAMYPKLAKPKGGPSAEEIKKSIAKKKLFAKDLAKQLGIVLPPDVIQSADEMSIGAFKKKLGKELVDDLIRAQAGKTTKSGLMLEQLIEQILLETGIPLDSVGAGLDLTLASAGKPAAKLSVPSTPIPPRPTDEEKEFEAWKPELDALIAKYTGELDTRFTGLKTAMISEATTFQNPADLINYGEKLAGETLWSQALERALTEGVDLGAAYGISALDDAGFTFDWKLPHREAQNWAKGYSYELVSGITKTTHDLLQDAVSNWIGNGADLRGLRGELEPVFGRKRAEMIASTEVTRAFSHGSHNIFRASGVVSHMQWLTSNDERVCPICGPLGGVQFTEKGAKPTGLLQQWKSGVGTEIDGQFEHPGGAGGAAAFTGLQFGLPPAHPRCRCRIAPVMSRLAFAAGDVVPPPEPETGTSPHLAGDYVEFTPGTEVKGMLNGVPLEHGTNHDWATLPDEVTEPPLPDAKGLRQSAGVVIMEPDGRVWLVEPTGHFGGYKNTFAKGGLEKGLTLQQTAMKEAYEETGLNVRIERYLTDQPGSTSMTRYYMARRVGSTPMDAHWESQKVKLLTPAEAKKILNVQRDQDVLAAALAKPTKPKRATKPRKGKTAVANPEIDKDGFPASEDSLSRLQVVSKLGGSTGAELVRDPQTGKKFVRKLGASADHLREEAYADQAYQAMGVSVPKMRLYETAGRPTKLSEFIEDAQSLGALKTSDRKRYDRAVAELRKDFAADALMANWDVMGASFDNILVDPNNRPWRIDNGGALRFRAQGSAKPGWNAYPTELWTMRNPLQAREAGALYSGIDSDEMAQQLGGYLQRKNAVLKVLPEELRSVMGGRFDTAADLVGIHSTLRADKWSAAYTDDFLKHSIGLRDQGIVEKFPKLLAKKGRDAALKDENGVPWDNLRKQPGQKDPSLSDQLYSYLDKSTTGNARIVTGMMNSQAGDSWSREAAAVKMMIANERGNIDAYWWKRGVDGAERAYSETLSSYNVKPEQYRDSIAGLHAFNYELMRNVDFVHNDRKSGAVTVMRTEARDVMKLNGLKVGEKGLIKRGPSESSSIHTKVSVYGSENTVMAIPHHRILGTYFMENPYGHYTIMAGDGENEFISILDGVESHYVDNDTLKKVYKFNLG